MNRSRPVLRLPPVLLALAAVLLLSAAAAQARARTHASHHKRGTCVASRSGATRRSSHAAGCKTGVHRSRSVARRRLRRGSVRRSQPGRPGAIVAAATCEDGTAPAAQGCGDGSEATTCPAGSVFEGAGVCRAAPGEPAGPQFSCEADETACSAWNAQTPNCQDGRDAVKGADGAYSCADGSEPACEPGFTPVLQGDRLIACEPGSEDPEEEAEEDEG
jgi:hypothetical protein